MAPGTRHPHHITVSEFTWCYNAFMPWGHYRNNILLFDNDSQITNKKKRVFIVAWLAPSHYLNQWWLVYRHISVSLGLDELTLNVRGPSYLGLTRSISWLLMSWLLASPGHQQPWYWLYVEWVGPCLIWQRISTTCVISMWRNDKKCEYMF